jgi:hypothetical protein
MIPQAYTLELLERGDYWRGINLTWGFWPFGDFLGHIMENQGIICDEELFGTENYSGFF